MANVWGLPDNEVNQMKRETGIPPIGGAVAPAPAVKTASPVAQAPAQPDMKPYRYLTPQELASQGAGPITSLVGGGIGALANKLMGDDKGQMWGYTSKEAQNRVEGKKIADYEAGTLGGRPGHRILIPGIASIDERPRAVTANSQTPQRPGTIDISPQLQPTSLPTPTTAVLSTQQTNNDSAPADPGKGFAVAGGRRVNYPAIGTTADPLRAGFDGSGRVAGQRENSLNLIDNIITRHGGDSQEYKDQVAQAMRINAANGFAPTAEQIRTTGMSNADVVNLLAANNKKNRYTKQIAAIQGQEALDLQGQKLKNDATALETELGLKRDALSIEAGLKDAQAKHYLSEAAKNAFELSPEGVKRKLSIEGLKDQKDLVGKFYDNFKGLSLPQDWAGKHMELAKKYAMAEDPNYDYGIYFNPSSPNKMGIGVKKSMFEPLLQKYRQAGYQEKDAMAHAFSDLKEIGRSKGMQQYEDIPNMDRFTRTANKPASELGA